MSSRGSTAFFALAVVGAAILFAVSTGAVVLDGPTDPITDDVALQPGDNPYAYLDEDGELAIDVTEDNPRIDAEGVNVDAVAAQEALFYITYDGNASAEAWIEHEGTGVTFVVNGEPVESPERAVRLTPERDAVPVGVEIDTRVAEIAPGDRLIDEISVRARPTEPESPEEPGGDDGSDGDGESDGLDPTAGPTASVERPDATHREVELLSVVGGSETEVDLRGLHVGDPSVRLDDLTFVRESPGDVEFAVRGRTDRPAEVPPVPPGVDPIGYYTVEFAEPGQPIAEATAEITVDRERLEETGVAPERFAVYRETDVGWERVETRVVGAGTETVRFRAVSEGFSAFAVAAERPALAPAEASLSDDQVRAGEPLTVAVDIENIGRAPARDAELQVAASNGESLATGERVGVDVAPGGTASASVTVRFDDPGEYDLVLAGEAVEARATDERPVLGSVTVADRADGPGDDGTKLTDGDGVGADSGSGSGDDSGSESVGDSGSESVGDSGSESVGDSGSGSGDDSDETSPELSEFDLGDVAGLAALVGIVLATLFLVRRAPR
ncbi:PGF-pre-PGF domain-containing protein [Halorubrum xinjiangense]|uniref:PGF-pre-PGF domain-containing protein n=1 Tax=Halorubrum xinjiangense TaxID=261291 RepID=A0A1G7IQP6_9EURY|nr:PGF-pre-PGF domain-containing protein [Halorubrum xinjiangense]SDF14886.1 PGF-pre-PGF domain-containing protein [Halorubrum xinjiangense]